MADYYSYLQYKRDQRHLLYWMIHAYNSIIKSSPSAASDSINNTGQITISSFVPVTKLIAKHVNPIPSTIYRLFQSIIAARKSTHAVFQQIVSNKPDPEIERSNASHRRFIDVLTEAFAVLGGEDWVIRQKNTTETTKIAEGEDLHEVIFANKFSMLHLGDINNREADEEENEEVDEPITSAHVNREKKKPSGKGKKGKRGRKAKGKPKLASKEPDLEEVPLESYRIIEDESGLVTDYLMAVYSLLRQWGQLRHYLQGLWREVSYGGLNSAIAGELSNIAIAMVKQTESSIWVDFPGHDSYETVMNTITRGNVEKAQSNFHIMLHRIGSDETTAEKVHEVDVDIQEQFSIHMYQALLDFITDFRQTRSGKPTKRMLSEIKNWDPSFDLQRASKEQRIQWRRAYTINWLYDLVNVFSSIVVQRITMKGQKIILESVDWSINGPWNEHRRLYGLNEFAGEVTSLAMQKPSADVRPKILPHTVFQLQCIVDSLTVSRGWSLHSLYGHVIYPPAKSFRARRDVDLFLDRENKAPGRGYCAGIDVLKQLCDRDAMMHGDEKRHKDASELLAIFRDDFVNWLGESKYMYGLTTIPPSRFAHTNANGLWEYSPFLCGVGLMEALELAYAMGFFVMDRMPEPMCVIHLHNMLVQKGYIDQPVGLYGSLQELFPDAYFAQGEAPTSNFAEAFRAVTSEPGSRRATFQRRAISRTATGLFDIHDILDVKANHFFKNKSILRIYREANWVPEKIPDEEVPVQSALCMLRLSQIRQSIDPVDGRIVFADTLLINRAKRHGLTEKDIFKMSKFREEQDTNQAIPEALLKSLPEGYSMSSFPQPRVDSGRSKSALSDIEQLSIYKLDIITEISGRRPVLSLNYIWATSMFMLLFVTIEEKLKGIRNPLWVQAYEGDSIMTREKRLSLTAQVLASEDNECMEVMAEAFQNLRSGFMGLCYWDDLDTEEPGGKDPLESDIEIPSCSVM